MPMLRAPEGRHETVRGRTRRDERNTAAAIDITRLANTNKAPFRTFDRNRSLRRLRLNENPLALAATAASDNLRTLNRDIKQHIDHMNTANQADFNADQREAIPNMFDDSSDEEDLKEAKRARKVAERKRGSDLRAMQEAIRDAEANRLQADINQDNNYQLLDAAQDVQHPLFEWALHNMGAQGQ
jgi:hypothetical protein